MPVIAYMSDLHLEVWESETRSFDPKAPRLPYPLNMGPSVLALKEKKIDALVLAGDVGRGKTHSPREAGTLNYARQAAEFLGCPVVVVPGNHEYYGCGDFAVSRAALLSSTGEGVHVLDRGECVLNLGDKAVRFLGATMWTDYLLSGNQKSAMLNASRRISDHRYIGERDTHFTVENALEEHRQSRAWMGEALARPHDGPTVVVTHHVPHGSFRNPNFELDHMTAAFCSNLDDLITAAADTGVIAWVFGHHHVQVKAKVRGVHYLSAQPGYPRERIGFTGPKTFEI